MSNWREPHRVKDKRITGEGAMKGWVTRRRRLADRRAALAQQVAALPRRQEKISGQTFNYVKLDDVLALVDPEFKP